PGAGVTFTSKSTDSDGTIVGYSWDLDGDGVFGDATGPTATATLLQDQTVALRVTDNLGGTSTLAQDVVRDKPPVASFTYAPTSPLVGQAINFKSSSTDADGSIVSWEWDL